MSQNTPTALDVVIMAAAPADFRPVQVAGAKIKKSEDGSAPSIDLTQNPDILHELVTSRTDPKQVIVGFAAETGDATTSVLEYAQAKFARKGCDVLVVNDVGDEKVFGRTENEVTILTTDGDLVDVPRVTKSGVAHAILDQIVQRVK